MKLIRLTDDRYVLDAGPDVRPVDLDAIRAYWKDWWEQHPEEIPEVIVFGGSKVPLEYEDRREPDIESRLASLEANVASHEQAIGKLGGFDV